MSSNAAAVISDRRFSAQESAKTPAGSASADQARAKAIAVDHAIRKPVAHAFGFCECGKGISPAPGGGFRETHDTTNPDCSEYQVAK